MLCELFCLSLEDDGTAFRRNVGNYSPKDTASRRRTQSLSTPLSEPQISLKNFNVLLTCLAQEVGAGCNA